jgi:hypothetical protein
MGSDLARSIGTIGATRRWPLALAHNDQRTHGQLNLLTCMLLV